MRKHWYSEKKNRVIATIETDWRGWDNWGLGWGLTRHHCADPCPTTLFFALGFLHIWIGLPWGKDLDEYYDRETSVQVYTLGGDIVFTGSIWHTDGMWESGTPWYRYFYINVKDAIFGAWKSVDETLEFTKGEWIDPMDGKSYAAEYKLVQYRQHRKRIPFLRHQFHRLEIDLGDEGPAVPGKGENSWDCGEDARFSTSIGIGPEPVPEDWISFVREKFTEGVLKDRVKYGGKNWSPSRG